MRYIPDDKGRFAQRPYYSEAELDALCERKITEFLTRKRGKVAFPIETDDLKSLIEQDASDLDAFADLSSEGVGVQGVTDFFPGKKPKVRISHTLSGDASEHRLRTTLSHEWGHVWLHAPLYDAIPLGLDLFPSCCPKPHQCHRHTIVEAHKGDWLEWLAGFVCGAVLMPASHVQLMLNRIAERTGHYGPALISTGHANGLINTLSETYHVSKDAARVRLERMGRIVRVTSQNLTMPF